MTSTFSSSSTVRGREKMTVNNCLREVQSSWTLFFIFFSEWNQEDEREKKNEKGKSIAYVEWTKMMKWLTNEVICIAHRSIRLWWHSTEYTDHEMRRIYGTLHLNLSNEKVAHCLFAKLKLVFSSLTELQSLLRSEDFAPPQPLFLRSDKGNWQCWRIHFICFLTRQGVKLSLVCSVALD